MPPKRLSTAEKIEKIRTSGEDVVFETLQELEQESAEYRGLRFHGRRAQYDQNRVLELYKQFTAVMEGRVLGDAPTDQDLELACFPDDHAAFYSKTRRFIIFIIAQTKPRSSRDEHITYSTASSYRRHLMFWTRRVYEQREGAEIPRASKVFNHLTEAMRGAAMRRQLGKSTAAKAYIGLPEIQYMIDIDMKATPCVEVAEQHHLAWCLGRVTALRPSSLGPQPDFIREKPGKHGYDDFLMWQDVKITKNTTPPGSFTAKIKIRNLKTNRVDPETDPGQELNFNILSPQNPANIPFSVPHRLLMIALRRGALESIRTTDDLIDTNLANITIKPSFLNQPIFLAATHRGLSLEENKPMPAAALTKYIQIRGRMAGFPDKLSFYSIRRRLATDLVQSYGADAAREVLGHDPASRVLETSYLEFNAFRHTTALGLGEDIEGQEQERRAALHQQLIQRLDEDLIEKSRGEALNVMVQESLNADPEFEKLTDANEVARYIRRTRRFAFDTLWNQLHQEAARTLTPEVLEERTEDLQKASAFASHILSLVKQSPPDSTDPNTDIVAQDIDFGQEFPEQQDLQTVHEDDIEERTINSGIQLEPTVDEGDHDDSQAVNDTVSYVDVVRTFFDILRTNSLSTYNPNEMVKCPLCGEDPTISRQEKDHERTITHHREHLNAKLHSPFERFRRETQLAVQQETDTTGEKARFECPFCNECIVALAVDADEDQSADELTAQSWHRFDYLVRHIDGSDENGIEGRGTWKLDRDIINMHDELKRQAGWYEPEFKGETARSRVRAKMRKTEAKGAGVKWTDETATKEGIPIIGRPGLVRGGESLTTDEILKMYPGVLTDTEPVVPSQPDLLTSYSGLLTHASPNWGTDTIMSRWPAAFTTKQPTSRDFDSKLGHPMPEKKRRRSE